MNETVTILNKSVIEELGASLELAWTNKTPLAPLSESTALSTVDDAYRVQEAWTTLRLTAGDELVGRKIGLTSEAVQRQLGVSEPDFGNLWKSRYFDANTGEVSVPAELFLQPRVEGELAFRMGKLLRGPGLGLEDVLGATEAVAYAIEIVDSRIADWKIKLVDTVADNASFGGFCHGTWQRDLFSLDLSTLTMTLQKNGETAVQGVGVACLKNPALAVAWLANTLSRFDVTLNPGDIVMSGAWMPMAPAKQGDVFRLGGAGGVPFTLRFV
jgi:2-keto-4-pentenoate hydratase